MMIVSPVKTREGKAESLPHWNMYIVGICQWVKRRDGLLSGKKKTSKKSRDITQRLVTIHKEHGIINVTALKIFFFFTQYHKLPSDA